MTETPSKPAKRVTVGSILRQPRGGSSTQQKSRIDLLIEHHSFHKIAVWELHSFCSPAPGSASFPPLCGSALTFSDDATSFFVRGTSAASLFVSMVLVPVSSSSSSSSSEDSESEPFVQKGRALGRLRGTATGTALPMVRVDSIPDTLGVPESLKNPGGGVAGGAPEPVAGEGDAGTPPPGFAAPPSASAFCVDSARSFFFSSIDLRCDLSHS